MWDVFKDWIFDIIHFFYDFCGDWGLAIICLLYTSDAADE